MRVITDTPLQIANRVVDALAAVQLTYQSEVELHRAIEAVLYGHDGLPYAREVTLTAAPWCDCRPGRIDFLIAGCVGLEVKVAGSYAAVARQLLRYSHATEVKALLLVTTVAQHHRFRDSIGGVPLGLYSLIGQGL